MGLTYLEVLGKVSLIPLGTYQVDDHDGNCRKENDACLGGSKTPTSIRGIILRHLITDGGIKRARKHMDGPKSKNMVDGIAFPEQTHDGNNSSENEERDGVSKIESFRDQISSRRA